MRQQRDNRVAVIIPPAEYCWQFISSRSTGYTSAIIMKPCAWEQVDFEAVFHAPRHWSIFSSTWLYESRICEPEIKFHDDDADLMTLFLDIPYAATLLLLDQMRLMNDSFHLDIADRGMRDAWNNACFHFSGEMRSFLNGEAADAE
jgi:hypothetical protein